MSAKEFDEVEDPLERLERNERQGTLAFRFFLVSTVVVVAVAALVITLVGGIRDECGGADGLCLTAGRIEVVAIPTLVSLLLSVFSAWKTYQVWSRHIRWRPWLFATYAMWMLTTACLLLTSSVAFVEVG
ncbi:hypothetical protein K3888_07845 [Dietzia aurantiaca]|uniref:hypothetical protein n=1 Tax=Dietzia aurantiaca TaxID=983873 RepID=UPI001E54785C|nr:hypothetical protein [Dietzia aurantiaca]MCD2262612.1 hypothetical protein [Dietzia aurantiaca]